MILAGSTPCNIASLTENFLGGVSPQRRTLQFLLQSLRYSCQAIRAVFLSAQQTVSQCFTFNKKKMSKGDAWDAGAKLVEIYNSRFHEDAPGLNYSLVFSG